MQLLGSTVVHFGAASAAVSFVGGVLVVKFGGVLTAAALAGITRSLRQMMRPDTRAFVADYRGGVLATTAWRIAHECQGAARLDMPGALVASGASQYDTLRVFALHRFSEGGRRAVWADLEGAIDWASGAKPAERRPGP